MKNSISLTIISIVFFNSLSAQSTWSILSPTRTINNYVASSFINDDEGWLIDDQAILWHTSDGLITLDTLSTGYYFSKLAFVDALTGFALQDSNAYKTIDGGITWSVLTLPGNTNGAIYFLNKDTGFVSGFYEYFRTTNSGATWTAISTTGWTDYYFVNDSVGYVTTDDVNLTDRIYRTTDCGLTWTGVFQIDYSYMYSIWFTTEDTGYVLGFDDSGFEGQNEILKTTTGGLTWDNIDDLDDGDSYNLDLRFKNNHQEGFAFAEYGYATLNGGDYWNYPEWLADSLNFPGWSGPFNALDGFDVMYLAGNDGSLLKWENNPSKFQDLSGRICQVINDISGSENHAWLASDIGLLRSDDGGVTWNLNFGEGENMTVVEAVNDNFIIAGSTDYETQLLYRSTDGGTTWTTIASFPDTEMHALEIQMINEDTGYIFSTLCIGIASCNSPERGVWRTTDQGTTWQAYEFPPSAGYIRAMHFINANEGWLVQGGNPSSVYPTLLYHTTDGSVTWNIIYQNPDLNWITDVFFNDTQHGWMIAHSQSGAMKDIYETFDGGVTWSSGYNLPGSGENVKLFFIDALHGFFLKNGFIYETNDGGVIWQTSYESKIALTEIEYAGNGNTLAAGYYGFLIEGVNSLAVNVPPTSTPNDLNMKIYPNPVASTATIKFTLSQPSQVTIRLFSLDEKNVMPIADGNYSEGNHQLQFSRKNLAAGIYFLQLKTQSLALIEKIVIE
jgi:photosystem II stability/assembly factor-like uncharacterized protein